MDYDVLIIGAGVSGLAAARDASKSGLRVQILEGRAIIGGRVHSDESTGMDVGASWWVCSFPLRVKQNALTQVVADATRAHDN